MIDLLRARLRQIPAAHAVPRAFQIHDVDEKTDAPAAVDDPSADGAIDAPGEIRAGRTHEGIADCSSDVTQ